VRNQGFPDLYTQVMAFYWIQLCQQVYITLLGKSPG